MSLDRIHDVSGLMQFAAQPVIGTTGTASTVASNQYPGGYQFGAYSGIIAGSNSTGGGAGLVAPSPRGYATSDVQIPASSGTITHDNAAMVLISQSAAGGTLKLQPAQSHGQQLTLVFLGTNSGSITTGCTTTGVNGTTTAACQVLSVTQTFGTNNNLAFVALAQLGGTATTNVPYVWHRVGTG